MYVSVYAYLKSAYNMNVELLIYSLKNLQSTQNPGKIYRIYWLFQTVLSSVLRFIFIHSKCLFRPLCHVRRIN